MSMYWQRRSSSLRTGRDRGRATDLGTRIPIRSSSQPSIGKDGRPVDYQRSKTQSYISVANVGATPQSHGHSSIRSTPQNNLASPWMSTGLSSKKKKNQIKSLKCLQDKDFQRAAHTIVLEYFQNNCPDILNNGDIKPMTIKMFVDMINHFFAKLSVSNKDSNLIQFTQSNYTKEIPHWLKILEYPTPINQQLLQTVNVPLNWPSILGMLSWFVALVHTGSLYDLQNQLNTICMEGDKNKYLLVQYFFASTEAFRRNKNQESFSALYEEIGELDKQICGVSEEDIKFIKEELLRLQQESKNINLQEDIDFINELEQKVQVAESQNAKDTLEIKKINVEISDKKNSGVKKERNLITLKNEIEATNRDIQLLNNRVHEQSMSASEYAEIKKKCDNLNKDIGYDQKEYEDFEQVLNQYEVDITTKRDKILKSASTFNRKIIQLEQQMPQSALQGLRVSVVPESADAVAEITRSLAALKATKSRLHGECEEMCEMRRDLANQRGASQVQFRLASEQESTMRTSLAQNETEIVTLIKQIKEKEEEFISELKELEQKIAVEEEKYAKKAAIKELTQDLQNRMKNKIKVKEALDDVANQFWEKARREVKSLLERCVEMTHKNQEIQSKIQNEVDDLLRKCSDPK